MVVPGRFDPAHVHTPGTRRPPINLLCIDFTRMMDARVKPAHDDRADQMVSGD
jgi:hypothetical protein